MSIDYSNEMRQKFSQILVLGGGKIGSTIADMLIEYHQISVTLADYAYPKTQEPANSNGAQITHVAIDVQDQNALAALFQQHKVVINALPFFLATQVARLAADVGIHYLDLTEDVAATGVIRERAQTARSVLIPQCGLAPGVIGIAGMHLGKQFERLRDLQLRVGALGRHTNNAMRYNFTWSIDGVINEYCNPCYVIQQGLLMSVPALEGFEELTLNGEVFEAFHTSGGLGTLCETLLGRVQNLDYKTLRFPGHRDAMHFLINGLQLRQKRDLLRQVLEHSIAHTREDQVLMFVSATSLRANRLEQQTLFTRILGKRLGNQERTAIEISTASGVVGVLALLAAGKLPNQGFIRQEQIPLDDFLKTPSGSCFAGLNVFQP